MNSFKVKIVNKESTPLDKLAPSEIDQLVLRAS